MFFGSPRECIAASTLIQTLGIKLFHSLALKKGMAELYENGNQIMQKIELKMILASNAEMADATITHIVSIRILIWYMFVLF